MIHQLKLAGEGLAEAVACGNKTYEIRENDRNYNVGDILCMSLFDTTLQEYVQHRVSEYAYIVTYVSDLDFVGVRDYKVLAINRAFIAKHIMYALASKFYYNSVSCSIITTGVTLNNCKIISVRIEGVTVEYNSKQLDLLFGSIVWITPSYEITTENRSIRARDISFNRYLPLDIFEMYSHYQLFTERSNLE